VNTEHKIYGPKSISYNLIYDYFFDVIHYDLSFSFFLHHSFLEQKVLVLFTWDADQHGLELKLCKAEVVRNEVYVVGQFLLHYSLAKT
jgi:hypothetical protein